METKTKKMFFTKLRSAFASIDGEELFPVTVIYLFIDRRVE